VTPQAAIPARTRDVLRLAWPTILSFVCSNLYRVNDHYWIQDLGPDAQAAVGASFFVLVMNFAFIFISVAGCLPLVARATGAREPEERSSVVFHAILLSLAVGLTLSVVGSQLTPTITGWLGLEGATQEFANEYLSTIYLWILPLAFAPLVDNIFIGMGHTRVPLILVTLSVTLNFILNPILIFGWGPLPAGGIAGAAMATAISRLVAVIIGLALLHRYFSVPFLHKQRLRLHRILEILRLGTPPALSTAMWAGTYWILFSLVMSRLGRDAIAGLGLGFNIFEGAAFPVFLGIALAGSSLVGRNLGAKQPAAALDAMASVRRIGTAAGVLATIVFLTAGPLILPYFTEHEGVLEEALTYVWILGFSQILVAMETVNEKVLLGAGHTRPIFWIAGPGNLLRIPIAWFLAIHLGWAAPGVWWAVNITTALKAGAFYYLAERRTWLEGHIR
jgi:MATE family multidrug resistance protein